MRSIAFASLLVALALAGPSATASGKSGWPFWWWGETKANRVMVTQSPSRIFPIADATTVTSARCKGRGKYHRTARGVRLYHVFQCTVTFRNEVSKQIWTPEMQREVLAGRDPSTRWCPSVRQVDKLVTYGSRGCPR